MNEVWGAHKQTYKAQSFHSLKGSIGAMIYAIVPARSGSKGIPNKNIRTLAGKELIGYAIEFALKLKVDRVICSTDSNEYAIKARQFGAEVPFLRTASAAVDTAMEQDILKDLYDKFDLHGIPHPELFVWLRPTFVFRRLQDVESCIRRLRNDPHMTACRVVTEAEGRLYRSNRGYLEAIFDDGGKSMIRRQDAPTCYRVFHADVFRGKPRNDSARFLGNRIGYEVAPKICGLDIDDSMDLMIAEYLIEKNFDELKEYLS